MDAADTHQEIDGGAGFWAAAQRHPDKVAVIDATGQRTTYRALVERVNRLSHLFRSTGLGTGDHLAYLVPNTVDAIALPLAALQIGVYYTPVNFHLVAREIAHVLSDSRAQVFVAHADFADIATAAADAAGLPDGRRFATGGPVDGFADLDTAASQLPTTSPADRTHGPVFFYTSGTTGQPKGVISAPAGTPIRQAIEGSLGALWDGLGYSGDMTFLVQGPLYHAGPHGYSLPAIHRGGTLVLMQKWTPERALELIQEHRVTSSFMVPTMFHRLLALDARTREAANISSIQGIGHSGAMCPVKVKRAMIDWWGPVFLEVYGGSEGTVAMCTSEEWLTHPGTVGRVVTQVEVIDESGRPAESGEIGTVYFSAPGVEYFDDPAKTQSARRGSMLTLGDMGYLVDSEWLYLVDRRTDLIIAGGVNIYPAEIEAVLLDHPWVQDVGVVGVPHPEWGHEVRAFVQLTPAGVSLAPDAVVGSLTEHTGRELARFKIPREFVLVDDLPRTPAGKLLRRRLRDEYVEHIEAGSPAPVVRPDRRPSTGQGGRR